MVTNPGTRTWEVTASTFATLNDMFGNRTVCGIGRGDSAMRVAGRKPNTLARHQRGDEGHPRPRPRATRPTVGGTVVRFPWVKPGAELPVWMAAYGPKALEMTGEEADGFILQLADPYLTEYMVKAVKDAAVAAGRDPADVKICVAAPAYVTEDDSPEALAHARDQCRWFGGMVGNHVADLVSKYGEHSAAVPEELTDYIKAREGYDYRHHGRAGQPRHRSSCPTRSSTGSVCIGPGRGAHREAERAARAGRRPVRRLRHARRAGGHDRRVRRDRSSPPSTPDPRPP